MDENKRREELQQMWRTKDWNFVSTLDKIISQEKSLIDKERKEAVGEFWIKLFRIRISKEQFDNVMDKVVWVENNKNEVVGWDYLATKNNLKQAGIIQKICTGRI